MGFASVTSPPACKRKGKGAVPFLCPMSRKPGDATVEQSQNAPKWSRQPRVSSQIRRPGRPGRHLRAGVALGSIGRRPTQRRKAQAQFPEQAQRCGGVALDHRLQRGRQFHHCPVRSAQPRQFPRQDAPSRHLGLPSEQKIARLQDARPRLGRGQGRSQCARAMKDHGLRRIGRGDAMFHDPRQRRVQMRRGVVPGRCGLVVSSRSIPSGIRL